MKTTEEISTEEFISLLDKAIAKVDKLGETMRTVFSKLGDKPSV